jgi:hypothetical protein
MIHLHDYDTYFTRILTATKQLFFAHKKATHPALRQADGSSQEFYK